MEQSKVDAEIKPVGAKIHLPRSESLHKRWENALEPPFAASAMKRIVIKKNSTSSTVHYRFSTYGVLHDKVLRLRFEAPFSITELPSKVLIISGKLSLAPHLVIPWLR